LSFNTFSIKRVTAIAVKEVVGAGFQIKQLPQVKAKAAFQPFI